jgi:predicted ATPase
MLTRLKVSGFKNLTKVDIRFGAFTCIAGVNAVGKSNLFDAINFLSDLADLPLINAAMSVRDTESKASDIRSLFRKFKNNANQITDYADEINFQVEMIIPKEGFDDFGQQATATSTFLQYSLTLAYRKDEKFSSLGGLEIINEELVRVKGLKAKNELILATSVDWNKSVNFGGKHTPYISTGDDDGYIYLHQDQGKQGGGKVRRNAKTLPRTVLSSTNSAESPTALLVRNEMRSWKLLQLEPSQLRQPDNFISPTTLGEDGSHLAATLYNLAQKEANQTSNGVSKSVDDSKIYGEIATKLSELISDVYSVKVDRDEQRQTLTLQVVDKEGIPYSARALSDGTLRFLALSVIELNPLGQGVICLEEPENGMHPERIPAIVQLLQDIAVDTNYPVDENNPLQQVIVNTHSPTVFAEVPDDSILVAEVTEEGAKFSCLSNTWRSEIKGTSTVSKGKVLSYLNPNERYSIDQLKDLEDDFNRHKRKRRVIDRLDFQPFLPISWDGWK